VPTISPAFANGLKKQYPTYDPPRRFGRSHCLGVPRIVLGFRGSGTGIDDVTNNNVGAPRNRVSDREYRCMLRVSKARRFSHGYLRRVGEEGYNDMHWF
jgi:hypothetical protein